MRTAFGQALQAQTDFEVIEPTNRGQAKQPHPHVVHMERGTFGRPYSVEDLIAEETGTMVSLKGWTVAKERRDLLAGQSDEMRELLEEAGVPVWSDAAPLKMTGAVTGIEYTQRQKRNVNLLPDVAARNRRQQQLLFAKFAHRKKYLRYLVLTAGERLAAGVSEDGIKDRRKEMTRRISRWSSYVRKRFRMNVYLAALECPRDPETGTYHLHANIIYDGPKLSADEWSKFLKSTRRRLKFHAQDNGRLRDLNEAIKYVTKPEDFAGIEGGELAWLFSEWYRGRSFIPYGKFKAFVADAKERRLKVVERSNGDLVFMQKNTAKRKSMEERILDLAAKAGVDPSEITAQDVLEASQGDGAPENVILTVTQPTTAFGPFREPLIIHMGINHNAKSLESQGRYADFLYYRLKALEAWEKNTRMTPAEARRIAEQLGAGQNVVPLALKRQEQEEKAAGRTYRVHTSTLNVHFDKPEAQSRTFKTEKEEPPGSAISDPPPPERSFLHIFHQD